MKPNRMQRVNSELRREIAAILSGPLKDREPDLRGVISVTEADVAPDLKTAKVYVSVLAQDGAQKKRSLSVIRENAGFIRHALAGSMAIRTVPVLTFLEDGSMEYGSRIDALLAGLGQDGKDGE